MFFMVSKGKSILIFYGVFSDMSEKCFKFSYQVLYPVPFVGRDSMCKLPHRVDSANLPLSPAPPQKKQQSVCGWYFSQFVFEDAIARKVKVAMFIGRNVTG